MIGTDWKAHPEQVEPLLCATVQGTLHLTIPFEDTYAAAPRHTVGIFTEALNYVGAEVVVTVLAPGVHRRREVRQRADLMTATQNAGHEIMER